MGSQSFEEFVEQELAPRKLGDSARIQSQRSYVVNKAGQIGVDTLIKIEYLDALLPDFLRRFGIKMAAPPTRLNISPTTVTGDMSEDLVRKISTSERFGPDLDLYNRGVEVLPDSLPERTRRERKAKPLPG